MATVIKALALMAIMVCLGLLRWLVPVIAGMVDTLLAGIAIGLAFVGFQWLMWVRQRPKRPKPPQFRIRL